LKCGSNPKQERRRGKRNEDNADLMYKPPREESDMSFEEQTRKEPRDTLKPSLEVLVNEYSNGFKAYEKALVAVTQLECFGFVFYKMFQNIFQICFFSN
jgi:hypothetical protein